MTVLIEQTTNDTLSQIHTSMLQYDKIRRKKSSSSSPLLAPAVVGEDWSSAILSLCIDMGFSSAGDDVCLASIVIGWLLHSCDQQVVLMEFSSCVLKFLLSKTSAAVGRPCCINLMSPLS